MTEDEKKVLELARKWYAESGLKFTDELWFAVGQMCERERIRPTQRPPDARKSALKKVSSNKKGSAKPARG